VVAQPYRRNRAIRDNFFQDSLIRPMSYALNHQSIVAALANVEVALTVA
jgi:hypothetical protein